MEDLWVIPRPPLVQRGILKSWSICQLFSLLQHQFCSRSFISSPNVLLANSVGVILFSVSILNKKQREQNQAHEFNPFIHSNRSLPTLLFCSVCININFLSVLSQAKHTTNAQEWVIIFFTKRGLQTNTHTCSIENISPHGSGSLAYKSSKSKPHARE